ncbi:MAG: hypothetical protein AB7E24_11970 [Novosphingobium sp.]
MTDPVADERVEYRGIQLSSRYGLASEIAEMRAAVDRMPAPAKSSIETVFCDSKAGAVYAVTAKTDRWHKDFSSDIDLAFRSAGGHNGIAIDIGNATLHIEPWWEEQEP